MIRKSHPGDLEAHGGDDGRVIADEIEFPAGSPAWESRRVARVRAPESGRPEEHAHLPNAGEGVEVAGHQPGLVTPRDQIVQVAKLALPRAYTQRQMHKKEGDVLQLDLDGQTFETGFEIVKPGAQNRFPHQHGVRLFVEHRQTPPHALVRILHPTTVVEREIRRQLLGLIPVPRAVRSGVHLHQPHNIRVHMAHEPRDVRKVRGSPQQGLHPREPPQPASPILNVVQQQPHTSST